MWQLQTRHVMSRLIDNQDSPPITGILSKIVQTRIPGSFMLPIVWHPVGWVTEVTKGVVLNKHLQINCEINPKQAMVAKILNTRPF